MYYFDYKMPDNVLQIIVHVTINKKIMCCADLGMLRCFFKFSFFSKLIFSFQSISLIPANLYSASEKCLWNNNILVSSESRTLMTKDTNDTHQKLGSVIQLATWFWFLLSSRFVKSCNLDSPETL